VATIKEVADAAGVSTATVSRVLSGIAVTGTLRDRVLQAAKALDYAPNAAARSLRTTRAAKILVIVPDIANPFFATIIQSAEAAAQEAGYSVVLAETAAQPSRALEYRAMLMRKEADGIVFLGNNFPDELRQLAEQMGPSCPIVHGCEFDPNPAVPSAHIDDVAAASQALEHLYQLGHHRIGIVTGGLGSSLGQARVRGVRATAATWSLDDQLMVVNGDFSAASGQAAAELLLSRSPRPTAIFCFNDAMALGAISAVRAVGLSCPDDVSMVGFDDLDIAPFFSPPLTTIRQPMRALGRRSVELLLEVLRGERRGPSTTQLPFELVVRKSTARPNLDHEAA